MKTKVPDFKIGHRVAYSVVFLRATFQEHTATARARGTVVGTSKIGKTTLVEIRWDLLSDDEFPTKVTAFNLAHVGPNTRFARC